MVRVPIRIREGASCFDVRSKRRVSVEPWVSRQIGTLTPMCGLASR
jgi:hypothetical protein